MPERQDIPGTNPEQIGQQQIAELSGVFTWKRGRSYLFVGFDNRGRPVATDNENVLSADAAECFRNGKRAGLDIMQISYGDVTPVAFQYLAGKENYRGMPQKRNVDDLIHLSTIDTSGSTRIVTVSVADILSGIVQSGQHKWENSVSLSDQTRNGNTLDMYSVLIENPDDRRNAYALLFQPPIKGVSNESVYAPFVRDVLKTLIQMEAGQDQNDQKGLIACAKEMLDRTNVIRDEGLFISLMEALGILRSKNAKPDFLSSLAIKLFTNEVPGYQRDKTLMDSIDVQAKIATLGNDVSTLIRLSDAFYDRIQR